METTNSDIRKFIRTDPDAGKHLRQDEKGMAEDEMVGCPHQLKGHEFDQAPRDGDGQGSLECCSPWGLKELDMTEQLNNSNTDTAQYNRERDPQSVLCMLLIASLAFQVVLLINNPHIIQETQEMWL